MPRFRVTIEREGYPVYQTDLDADDEHDAAQKVLERESTPEWAVQSGWQDVRVDELPD